MKTKLLTKIGGTLTVSGLLIFLVLLFTLRPYAGSSGAGMAGLPVAFAMMLALIVLMIGIIMMIASFVLSTRKKYRH